MFYNTMFGFSVSTVYILFEMLITGKGSRLAGYSARQYGFCTLSATFDVLAMSGMTIAYAKDRQGFVALLSYLGLGYCFLCDSLILDLSFSFVELACVVWITLIAVSIACFKLYKQR